MTRIYKYLNQLYDDVTQEGLLDGFTDEQVNIVIQLMNTASDAGQNQVFREWDCKRKEVQQCGQ